MRKELIKYVGICMCVLIFIYRVSTLCVTYVLKSIQFIVLSPCWMSRDINVPVLQK